MSRDYSEPLYEPRAQSRTSRKEVKTRMRNRLGTNGEGPPSTYRTLLVAEDMAELLHLASNGRLQLQLIDTHTGHVLDWRNARAEASHDDDA